MPKTRLKLYNVTDNQYESMLILQDHKCKICNREEDNTSHRGTKKGLCVDHCHTTGRVRGLLCDRCNKGLGLFRDDTILLTNAIRYLLGDNR